MPTINQLSTIESLSSTDQIPVWSSSDGDAKKASLNQLSEFVQSEITASDDKITQYAAPALTAFSVQINDEELSVHLVLTPTAGFAAGTLVFPTQSKCVHAQEILVNCTQAITTLTIDGNGATVVGAPTTLAANAYFRMRYEIITGTWYRVG